MKKIKISLAVLAIGLMSFVTATNFSFDLDKTNSSFVFGIRHMNIAEFNALFKKYDTKMTATKADLSDAKIEFTAEAASVDTRNEQRDNHVRSADFLDTEKYPEIKFVSTSIKKGKGNNFVVEGDFTMHGVTKKVSLNAEKTGEMVNPETKKKKIGMQFKGAVNRLDYAVGAGFPEAILGNEVNFTANLEFVVNEQ
jgi:polyisoprenoid-binding protein YceI